MNEFRVGHFIALLFGVILLGAGSCASFISTESPLAACVFFVAVGAAVGTVMAGLARLTLHIKTTLAVVIALILGGLSCLFLSSLLGSNTQTVPVAVSAVAFLSGIVVIALGRNV